MNNFELISKVKSGLDETLEKSARSILSRLLVIVIFTSFIPTGYFVYVSYLQGVVEQQWKVESRVNDLTKNMYLIQATIKELELCLSSKDSDSNNHKWYCESAVSSYQSIAEHWPPVRREELIKNNAIPAMVIDSQYYLMLARNNIKKVQTSKSNDEVLLETLLNVLAQT